ncbi:MAG: GNAT family N-acetyltransferase [Flavobacteriales bacterium]|nr:MAG: GNAT family N-acetyltransferase [Flavobacteriales bacterium]
MEDQYTTVRLSEKHYPKLVELYARCFGVRLSLSEIKNKYDTSSFGARDLGYLALSADGSAAAYYGVFATKVQYQGVVRTVAQSGDTMTAPDHQRKGLFVRLARATYELAQREQVDFVFGFPNENSLPGFRDKLGWTFDDYLYDYRFRTGAPPFCEIASKARWLRHAYELYAKSLREVVPLQEVRNLPEGAPHQVRDQYFYSYKTLNGGQWARIGRLKAFVHARVHVYVGELDFPEDYSIAELGRDLRRLGRRFLARQVVVTLSGNHPRSGLLRAVADPVKSLPIGYLALNTRAPVGGIVFSRVDLDTF